MKKYLASVVILFITLSSHAQVVNSFLDQYGRDSSIEVVNIGKRMLEKIQSDDMASSELQEAVSGLENIKIISSDDSSLSEDYYRSAYELAKDSGQFTEVLSLDKSDGALCMQVRKSGSTIEELIIISKEGSDFYLVSITGDIQLDALAKYSESKGVKSLNKLNNIQ